MFRTACFWIISEVFRQNTEVIMPIVEVAAGGSIKIPRILIKKYRIRKGLRVNVTDENGVITVRPVLADCVRLARKAVKAGM
jgi:hypothetical protein